MAALPIFLVEDSAIIRDSLIPALQDLTVSQVVAFAESEKDATQWLDAHPDGWRLAVIDLFLHQGSGLGVLRHCCRRHPDQRAVVLSNYATPEMRRRCIEIGADAVFDKSNELEAFIDYCKALGA